MRIRGESGFIIQTPIPRGELLNVINQSLTVFAKTRDDIAKLSVEYGHDNEIHLTLVLNSGSAVTAEALMDQLAALIQETVQGGYSTSAFSRGSTELLPA